MAFSEIGYLLFRRSIKDYMRQHICKIVGVLLPSSTSEEGPADFRIQRKMQTRHCIHYESPRLLQCVLAGLSQSNIAQLQRVHNAAVRLVSGLRPRDHVTSSLHELHWLPIRYRIIYKLCLMMHSTKPTSVAVRSSASNKYELPALRLTIGERAFRTSGSELTSIMDTCYCYLTVIAVF